MKTAKIVIIACFAAFICVGAWIQLPFIIPDIAKAVAADLTVKKLERVINLR